MKNNGKFVMEKGRFVESKNLLLDSQLYTYLGVELKIIIIVVDNHFDQIHLRDSLTIVWLMLNLM